MRIARKTLAWLDRRLAVVMAVVWLGLGVAGLFTGLQASRWPIVGASLSALLYGALWVRVAIDGRLLNMCQDLFAPCTKAPGHQQLPK